MPAQCSEEINQRLINKIAKADKTELIQGLNSAPYMARRTRERAKRAKSGCGILKSQILRHTMRHKVTQIF